jgi:hypothetical protein
MKYTKTLGDLREYAEADNLFYILGRLEILEIEIQTEIAKQKIELLKKYI